MFSLKFLNYLKLKLKKKKQKKFPPLDARVEKDFLRTYSENISRSFFSRFAGALCI